MKYYHDPGTPDDPHGSSSDPQMHFTLPFAPQVPYQWSDSHVVAAATAAVSSSSPFAHDANHNSYASFMLSRQHVDSSMSASPNSYSAYECYFDPASGGTETSMDMRMDASLQHRPDSMHYSNSLSYARNLPTCENNLHLHMPPAVAQGHYTVIEEHTSYQYISPSSPTYATSTEQPLPDSHRDSVSSTTSVSSSTIPTIGQNHVVRTTYQESTDLISTNSPLTKSQSQPQAQPRRRSRLKSTSDDALQDSTNTQRGAKLTARRAHSLVERKYRENLNLKISQLHQTLQNTQYGSLASPKQTSLPASVSTSHRSSYDSSMTTAVEDEVTTSVPASDNETVGNSKITSNSKFRKSEVLTDAMNYVNATEVELRHMSEEIARLNSYVRQLEQLVAARTGSAGDIKDEEDMS